MSQEQVALDAGMHMSAVSRVEAGTQNTSFATMLRVARALDTRAWKLVRLAEEDEPVD